MTPLQSGHRRVSPHVLVDQPDDGYCESLGWVEATVGEDEARGWLAEFCCGEDGATPYRPTGRATRVHLRVVNPAEDWEYQRWVECKPTAKTGSPFWQIVVD